MLNHIPDPIKIIDYQDDGKETRYYRFRLISQSNNPNWQDAKAGQFFMLNVPEQGEAPFTFTEPPNEKGEFCALIRKMGSVTSALFNRDKQAMLGARGPFGRGWPLNELANKPIMIVAGGCGLAPLTHLINSLLTNNHQQPITLIYGARNRHGQMLLQQQQRWQKSITIYHTLDEVEDEITSEDYAREDKTFNLQQGTPFDVLPLALASLNTSHTKVLLCGPEVMMTAIAKNCVEHGIGADSIYLSVERRMHCAVGLCGHCYLNEQYACQQGPTFSWQELQA